MASSFRQGVHAASRATTTLAALFLASCLSLDVSNGPVVASQPSDPATETFASSLQIDLATMQKTSTGVYYKDLKTGTGATYGNQNVVQINYLTFLKNGALVDQRLNVTVDLSAAIPGLRDGLVGMQIGSERLIVIPSERAYGARTDVPLVPPNSTLVLDVILAQIL